MIQFKIGKSLNFFLDRPLIVKAIAPELRKALASGAGYIRRVARNSMKPGRVAQGRDQQGRFTTKRRQASKPGEPPRRHTGLLRDRLFFAADLRVPLSPSVVIGPERVSGVDGVDVPHVLEFGGTIRTKSRAPRQFQVGEGGPIREDGDRIVRVRLTTPAMASRASHIARRRASRSDQTRRIAARPYMAPALLKSLPKIPAQFQSMRLRGAL